MILRRTPALAGRNRPPASPTSAARRRDGGGWSRPAPAQLCVACPDRAISVAAADPLTGFYVNSFYVNSMSASTLWWSVWGTRMARVMRTVAARETST